MLLRIVCVFEVPSWTSSVLPCSLAKAALRTTAPSMHGGRAGSEQIAACSCACLSASCGSSCCASHFGCYERIESLLKYSGLARTHSQGQLEETGAVLPLKPCALDKGNG
ncbi:hypothetical protein EDD37DRAFT_32782 [Exophiala viscosa]|uniref:uncharacterized protein n=1 Tax=Exophiala viscosa TaxID=2486360 RepID=UPI0021925408|nr:hypothetical protein EDD37DRAFT_32782 [Exophiala viscosa]